MTFAVRRLPTQLGGPARICVVRLLASAAIQHDLVALSPAEARAVGLELIAAADQAEIEQTGGVPPVPSEPLYDGD